MEKEEDISTVIFRDYGGLLLIGLGIILLYGAIRRCKWAMDMTGQRTGRFNPLLLLYDLFGDNGLRIGLIITSIVVILSGIGLMVVMSS